MKMKELSCFGCGELFEVKLATYLRKIKNGQKDFYHSRRCKARLQGRETMKKANDRFWSRVNKTPGLGPNGTCWEWTGRKNPRGYGIFSLGPYERLAHRLSYCISKKRDINELPSKRVVRHKCDNTSCVNPKHLILGSQKDNMRDARERNRTRCGERHSGSILTNDDVLCLRLLYSVNTPLKTLKSLVNVQEATLLSALNGKTWKHLPNSIEELNSLFWVGEGENTTINPAIHNVLIKSGFSFTSSVVDV